MNGIESKNGGMSPENGPRKAPMEHPTDRSSSGRIEQTADATEFRFWQELMGGFTELCRGWQEEDRLTALSEELLATKDDGARPGSFDAWLNSLHESPTGHFSSVSLGRLRTLDRCLWDWNGPPIADSTNECTDLSFSWDDVVMVRASGQVTTRAAWIQLVDARYRFEWQSYLATWACNETEDLRHDSGFLAERDAGIEISMIASGRITVETCLVEGNALGHGKAE